MANQNQDNDDNNLTPPKPANPDSSSKLVGRRLKNPLSICSSYNYHLSLYMMTPEALDVFINNGGTSLEGIAVDPQTFDATAGVIDRPGAYLVAQSGGVNNSSELRSPFFNYDYYMDDLEFETTLPKESGSAAVQHTFKFTVTEPYGFSFVTNLRRAADALAKFSNRSEDNPENPTKHFFMLGVRFYGYDSAGIPLNGTAQLPVVDINGRPLEGQTEEIDPGNTSTALFSRYFPVLVTKISNKIEGKETVYKFEAQAYAMEGLGTKRAFINNKNISVEGSTVEEALQDLMTKVNRGDGEKSADNKNKTLYSFTLSQEAQELIGKASIIVPGDEDKFKWPGSGATSTKQVNPAEEVSNRAPDKKKRTIKLKQNSSIVQAIEQIIAQSTYLTDGMKVLYDTSLEPDKTDAPKSVEPDNNKRIKWFSCAPDLISPKWDPKTKDWSYEINYIIEVYETPITDSSYTNPGISFYGPYKIYDYWYTGQNTEILRYSQEINNSYYLTYLSDNIFGTSGNDQLNTTEGSSSAPKVKGQETGQPDQGKPGLSMEAQNTYITSLYDPGATATATIEIMGDPDLMSNTVPRRGAATAVYNKFYGADETSIDYGGGQAVILVRFNEAVDYDSQGVEGKISSAPGTLSINSSILFWRDPKDVNKNFNNGIFFWITSCKSTLSKGQFKQTLTCSLQVDAGLINKDDSAPGEAQVTGRESSSTTLDALFKGDWVSRSLADTKKSNKGVADDPNYKRTGRGDAGPLVRGIADQENFTRRAGTADRPGSGSIGIADNPNYRNPGLADSGTVAPKTPGNIET